MTVAVDQLSDTIQNLKDAGEAALAGESAQQFADFEKYVNEVEAYVREVQQAYWADKAKVTIKSLEKGEPLTQSDKEVIRTFLISDAQHYLQLENNFGDWKRELQRLMDDLVRRSNMVDRDSVANIRGVLKDAIRLVPDIRNYLEERQRVSKFEQALNSLDDASRQMLVRLVREQLRSSTR